MRICGKGPDCLYAKYNFLFFIISFGGQIWYKVIFDRFCEVPLKNKATSKQFPALYDENSFHKENLVVTMKRFSKLKVKAIYR